MCVRKTKRTIKSTVCCIWPELTPYTNTPHSKYISQMLMCDGFKRYTVWNKKVVRLRVYTWVRKFAIFIENRTQNRHRLLAAIPTMANVPRYALDTVYDYNYILNILICSMSTCTAYNIVINVLTIILLQPTDTHFIFRTHFFLFLFLLWNIVHIVHIRTHTHTL